MISKEQFDNLQVGSRITCTSSILKSFTYLKKYPVSDIRKEENEVIVINDNNEMHYLTLRWYLKDYFEVSKESKVVPADDVSICLIEINQCIKIQQNKVCTEERVLKTLEEAKRLLSKS